MEIKSAMLLVCGDSVGVGIFQFLAYVRTS